jgi:hypothetical protein
MSCPKGGGKGSNVTRERWFERENNFYVIFYKSESVASKGANVG